VAEPVFKLNLKDPQLANYKGKNPANALQPAEVAIHPTTGAIYLTEASNPQLFILNADGTIKSRYKLDDKVFTQPEGITFSPSGELYISNEGKKENGNILKVQLKNL
jgi:DNA-binding beta-propeller fold protein YncE